MVIIGVTGGCGTGKTTVTRMLGRLGAKTVDCDRLVNDLYRPGTAMVKKIVKYFGPDMVNKNGRINKGKLAGRIFGDAGKMDKINRLVHPAVKKRIREIIADGRRKKIAMLVVEAPLLFEAGMENWFDRIIVVYCRPKLQGRRLSRTSGPGKEEILLRIKSQWPIRQKKQKADFIVDNNGSRAKTQRQVVKIWNKCREQN